MSGASSKLHLQSKERRHKGEHLHGAVTRSDATVPSPPPPPPLAAPGAVCRVGCGPGHVAENQPSPIQPRKPCLRASCGNGAGSLLGEACCTLPPLAGSLEDKKPKLPEDVL